MLGNPTQVPVGNQTIQICPAQGTYSDGRGIPVLIFNEDIINVAYVGYTNGNVTPSNGTAVQPLTYVVMDGSKTLYASCPTMTDNNNIILNVTPGGSYQSASPAQIQQQLQPALQVAFLSGQAAGTSNVILSTAASSVRIWNVWVGIMAACGAVFAGGFQYMSAAVQPGVGEAIEAAVPILNPSSQNENSKCMAINGLQVPQGLSIVLNVGPAVSGVSIRGWGGIIYSIP